MSANWFLLLPSEMRHLTRQVESGESAWPVAEANAFLESAKPIGFAILGGDVYKTNGSELTPTLENWHCDLAQAEPWQAYISRSLETAELFLSKLLGPSELWFVPVCTLKPSATQVAKSYTNRKDGHGR